jgi:hypothetical protein
LAVRSSIPDIATGDAAQWGATLRGLSRIRRDVIHDLRSRLHGMALSAEIMAEMGRQGGAEPRADAEAWMRMQTQSRALAESLRSLGTDLEDLLDQLDIEPGKPSAVDLGAALRGATRWLTTFARMREVGWTLDAPESGVVVTADPAALRRALFLLACETLGRAPAGSALDVTVVATPPDATLRLGGLHTEAVGALADHGVGDAVDAGTNDAGLIAVRRALAASGATATAREGALEIRWPLADEVV